MATAGTPASATPIRARTASSMPQLGAKAQATVSTPTAKSEAAMIGLRPRASEMRPATSMATASVPVVIESERLDTEGETPRSWLKTGSSGCTQ